MTTSDSPMNIKCNDMDVEQVVHFKYLGSTIENTGSTAQEVIARIGQASSIFNRLKKFGDRVLSLYGLSSAYSTATSCPSSYVYLKHSISVKNKSGEFNSLETCAYVDFSASIGPRR